MTKYYLFIAVLFILLSIGLLGSGCATKPVPEIITYTLDVVAREKINPSEKPVTGIIKVAIPQSSAAIMSRQILYQDKGNIQNAYLYSRWSEIPNKMLAQLLLAYLNQKQVFSTVLPTYSKGREEFLLESTLSEFYHHINADGSSTGRVRIKFYLIDVKLGQVVATKEIFSDINASSLDARGAVSALNTASQDIAIELAEWLATVKRH